MKGVPPDPRCASSSSSCSWYAPRPGRPVLPEARLPPALARRAGSLCELGRHHDVSAAAQVGEIGGAHLALRLFLHVRPHLVARLFKALSNGEAMFDHGDQMHAVALLDRIRYFPIMQWQRRLIERVVELGAQGELEDIPGIRVPGVHEAARIDQ